MLSNTRMLPASLKSTVISLALRTVMAAAKQSLIYIYPLQGESAVKAMDEYNCEMLREHFLPHAYIHCKKS